MPEPRPSTQNLFRELARKARDTRSELVKDDRPLRMREVYGICYLLARRLHWRYRDLRIMVGDLAGDRGLVQHHWIEIPSRGAYLDPACDLLDPFQPVRCGNLSDPDFVSSHRNGLDANIDINDPRNRPDVLYKSKTAWDTESSG